MTILTVFLKEVLDNIRDRRTLSTSLIMGPIFGPILFSVVINLSIERSLDDVQKTLELPIIGAEHAPNLVDYLVSKNIDPVAGPTDLASAMDGVKLGTHDVVLVIPAEFGEQLADTNPPWCRSFPTRQTATQTAMPDGFAVPSANTGSCWPGCESSRAASTRNHCRRSASTRWTSQRRAAVRRCCSA